MINNTGLSKEELENINSIFSKFKPIEAAILFGSRAIGNYRNGSDIDIALKGKNISLKDILNILIALDEISSPYKFDLVAFNRIQEPKLIDHINRVGIELYKNPVDNNNYN